MRVGVYVGGTGGRGAIFEWSGWGYLSGLARMQ